VLRGLRADWRRGRALRSLKLGERQYWEWESETDAGVICANLTFRTDGEVLVLVFHELWAKDLGAKGVTPRADLGLAGARRFLEIVSELAADAGFARLRVAGQRMRHRRKKVQRVEFDVTRYRRRR
jgi:hypothetical protein